VHAEDPGLSLYLPGTQLAQSPFLPDQPALIAGHGTQYVDATANSEYSPTLQSVHGIGPLWALCSPNLQPVQLPFVPVQPGLHRQAAVVVFGGREFAGQPTQCALPRSILYVPTAHTTHVPSFAPIHPASQRQAMIAVLLAGELEFAGQLTQSEFPFSSLYLLAAHATQSRPFAPCHPALHMHALSAVLLVDELEFAGQAAHPVCPFRILYVPAGHPTHVPPFAPSKPALHTQDVLPLLPTGEDEPGGHFWHKIESSYRLAIHPKPVTDPFVHQSAVNP